MFEDLVSAISNEYSNGRRRGYLLKRLEVTSKDPSVLVNIDKSRRKFIKYSRMNVELNRIIPSNKLLERIAFGVGEMVSDLLFNQQYYNWAY
jgi:hypothetical protein